MFCMGLEIPLSYLLLTDIFSACVIAALRRKKAIMQPPKKLAPTYTWVSNISIPIAVRERYDMV